MKLKEYQANISENSHSSHIMIVMLVFLLLLANFFQLIIFIMVSIAIYKDLATEV